MADKKILFISQEISPYLQTGESSELGRKLPQGMPGKKYEVRTFMPKFGAVNERRNQLHEVIRLSGLNIPINDNDHPLIIKVASMQPSRTQVYFIDSDDYFQKLKEDNDDYGFNRADNDERAIFFTRGTLETVRKLNWSPDIIQCSGAITALTPMYIRNIFGRDKELDRCKIIYMVNPETMSGGINPDIIEKLKSDGLAPEVADEFKEGPYDTGLLHRIGIRWSDAVIFHTEQPDESLLELVRQLGKPYATFAETGSDPNRFIEFYDSLSD